MKKYSTLEYDHFLTGLLLLTITYQYWVKLVDVKLNSYAGFSAGVRRMHDIGKSGWWIIVPVVSLVFACLDSQPHENEYGANPKAAPAV